MGSTCLSRQNSLRRRYLPQMELLQSRITPSVTPVFNADTGVLTITGDELDNVVSVAAVNGTATVTWEEVSDTGETTVVTSEPFVGVEQIDVNLQDGNDALDVDISGPADLTVNIDMPADDGEGGTPGEGTGTPGEDDCMPEEPEEPEPAPPGTLGGGDDNYTVTAAGVAKGQTLDINVGAGEGEDGSDDLTVELGNIGQDASVNIAADLGGGDNNATISAGNMSRNATLDIGVVADLGDSLSSDTAGDDSVGVSIGSINRDADVSVDATLGAGSDDFGMTTGAVGRDSSVTVAANVGVASLTSEEQTDSDNVDVGIGLIDRDADISVTADTGAAQDNIDVSTVGVGRGATVGLNLNGGAEADNVTADLGDIARDADVTVAANLGDGENEFAMNVGDIGRDANFGLTLTGGADIDNADMTFGDIARGVNLDLEGDLGAGDDTLDMEFTGTVSTLETEFNISFLGGDGEGDEATLNAGSNAGALDPIFGGFETTPTIP